jgi:hypothetical protein
MALSTDSVSLLKTVFGAEWQEAWVCWTGHMHGRRVKRLKPGDLPEAEDCYFCVAMLKPGAVARTLENAKRVHALVIDDVGTKIDAEAFALFQPLQPTWVIETSEGNYQCGYVIDGGTSVENYKAMRDGMRTHPVWGGSDGIDAVHLFRLPQGVNTKNGWRVSW